MQRLQENHGGKHVPARSFTKEAEDARAALPCERSHPSSPVPCLWPRTWVQDGFLQTPGHASGTLQGAAATSGWFAQKKDPSSQEVSAVAVTL